MKTAESEAENDIQNKLDRMNFNLRSRIMQNEYGKLKIQSSKGARLVSCGSGAPAALLVGNEIFSLFFSHIFFLLG